MREPTYDEETEILGFFEGAQVGLGAKIVGNRRLAIDDLADGRVVKLVSKGLFELPDDLTADSQAGLRIGTLESDGFALDLQGASVWAAITKRHTIRVSEQATRLWLYSRNILGSSIEWYSRGFEIGDSCIVVNPRGEALGIGVVVGKFKGNREAIKPIHDLGTYLRDQ